MGKKHYKILKIETMNGTYTLEPDPDQVPSKGFTYGARLAYDEGEFHKELFIEPEALIALCDMFAEAADDVV